MAKQARQESTLASPKPNLLSAAAVVEERERDVARQELNKGEGYTHRETESLRTTAQLQCGLF